jgi:hypothetical protein
LPTGIETDVMEHGPEKTPVSDLPRGELEVL